jgi:thymidylate kinase
MKRLNILCIDGAKGVGVSSQLSIMHNLLKSNNIQSKIFNLKEVDSIDNVKEVLLEMDLYLRENDGVALCDGSVASYIVEDLAKNMSQQEINHKHGSNLQIYESLNKKYNFFNVLLTPLSIDICNNRLSKKTNNNTLLDNEECFRRVTQGLKTFDKNLVTYNVKFHNIDILGDESILDIHNEIVNLIKKEGFFIEPSFD